jgi:hypothetical protein
MSAGFDGALMNCVFEGPRLSDILLAAGAGLGQPHSDVRPEHVEFTCFGKTQNDPHSYSGSIPFERAADPSKDVILALKVRYHPCTSRSPNSSHSDLFVDEWQSPSRKAWISRPCRRARCSRRSFNQVARRHISDERRVSRLLSAK